MIHIRITSATLLAAVSAAVLIHAQSPGLPAKAPEGMILIPGGSFQMGKDGGGTDEDPAHTVFLDPFYLSRTEITIWEYLACVHDGKCRMPDFWNKPYFEEMPSDEPTGWLRLPVTGVSWKDALDYCRWLGPDYRLPTEAEWEYACRAGTRTSYFWGNNFRDGAARFANVGRKLEPAGSHEPNPWGLYDMIGNAWEWCLDAYSKTYYRKSPQRNPCNAAVSPERGPRVVRGGSWNEYRWNLRSANRYSGDANRGYKGLGFRVALPIRCKALMPDQAGMQ
ncbi:formylglycine-generating enzyme family protein [bacterium]|nr:formylglycine-generating enzyme family protein [bacterium]